MLGQHAIGPAGELELHMISLTVTKGKGPSDSVPSNAPHSLTSAHLLHSLILGEMPRRDLTSHCEEERNLQL